MAANKTRKTEASVNTFLRGIADERLRGDCETLVELMGAATRQEPRMWGTAMVGFGEYHYIYDSGREGDWFLVGFSPRKQNLTLYLMSGFEGQQELLARLGPHTLGKSCLYVKRLGDLHLPTLRQLVSHSARATKAWAAAKRAERAGTRAGAAKRSARG